MTERPILFSAPMVRSILAGTKTQTRRAVKWQPGPLWAGSAMNVADDTWTLDGRAFRCPYGRLGDRLWVRETWMDLHGTGVEHRNRDGKLQRYAYGADTPPGSYGDEARKDYGLKWRPSIHMPRAASRITLEVTGVRVERLQDISDADARAEGIVAAYGGFGLPDGSHFHAADRRVSYWSLWDAINGAGSVESNPWVWVVEFRRLP